MNIATLMDLARQNAQIRSDRHLGMRLGVSEATPCTWRRGTSVPIPGHLINLCELANIPPEVGLAWRNVWQAEGEARAICERIANQVTDLAGVALPSEAA